MKASFNQSRYAWRIKSTQMMGQTDLGTRVKPSKKEYNRRKENWSWRKDEE